MPGTPPLKPPFNVCLSMTSTWSFNGPTWRPTDGATLVGACAYAMHFLDDQGEFFVHAGDENDPAFLDITGQFPQPTDVRDGLTSDHVKILASRYPGALTVITGQTFALRHVPRGVPVDLRTGPDLAPLPEDIRDMLASE